jgi:hypothetical protein
MIVENEPNNEPYFSAVSTNSFIYFNILEWTNGLADGLTNGPTNGHILIDFN